MLKPQAYVLNNEEINALFKFCAKHYVHDYDVQCELVDHLAEAIEAKLTADPSLSFEKALQQVYIGFGYNGFAQVVKTKTQEVMKGGMRARRRLFFSYFTWPKALIVCVAALLIYTVGNIFPLEKLNSCIIIVFALAVIAESILALRSRKLFKKPVKNLLMLSGSYFVAPVFSFQLFNLYVFFMGGLEPKYRLSLTDYYLLSASFVLFLLFKLTGYHYWKATYTQARERYPNAFAA
ncbi:MAG: hypothetical protein J0I41_17515 [Filimonas sp.]|nr:hypothetical protein [Filimonas sp.]